MDVSHEGARWLGGAEFERVLGVPAFWPTGGAPGGAKK
jgi:hypothetical protein